MRNRTTIMQAIDMREDSLVFVLNELGGIGDEWENTCNKMKELLNRGSTSTCILHHSKLPNWFLWYRHKRSKELEA